MVTFLLHIYLKFFFSTISSPAEWIQALWKQIRGIIGLISPDLPPGCTHSHVWQRLVLCRAVKSHSYPCKAVLTAATANRVAPLEATRPIAGPRGEGAAGTELSLQHPWSSLCCWNTRKDKRGGADPPGAICYWERDRPLAAQTGVTGTVGLIFGRKWLFYQCKQGWAVPGLLKEASRGGGGRGRGGGPTARENAASTNEKYPPSSQPRPAASSPEKSFCMLRYVRISNLRGHMDRGLVTLAGLAAQLFAQDSWDHVSRWLKKPPWHVLDQWHTILRPRLSERCSTVTGCLFATMRGLLNGCSQPLGFYWLFASAAHVSH